MFLSTNTILELEISHHPAHAEKIPSDDDGGKPAKWQTDGDS